MRIALPLWQERIAPVLDCCSKLEIIELENDRYRKVGIVDMKSMSFAQRLKTFREWKIDLVICNGISFFYRACLLINAIKVINNVSGETQKILLQCLNFNNKPKRNALWELHDEIS
jgi:hypothetical protein